MLPSTTDPRTARRQVVVGLLRAVLVTIALLGAYFALPLDRLTDVWAWLALPLALGMVVAVIAVEVRAIGRARLPAIRAVQALAMVVPFFLAVFAAAYYVMDQVTPSSFTESLSKLDALYFTVTVFATVGFGDIAATEPATRAVVTVQMVTDLILLGLGLRVIVGAVQRAREREEEPLPPATP